MRAITKLLVANRGEIALRIMRTCREMGIATVAVYSEADAHLPFVAYADEAVLIGPAASSESYLRVDRIIAAAQLTGASAIHPGYGFLSEKPELPEACDAAGIIFVGPEAHSIRVMGNKISAKDAVRAFDIPLVPGSAGAVEDVEEAKKIAEGIGFPVLVKAAAGGGGKGMRVVHNLEDFAQEMAMAQREAGGAFGDSSVFIEKYITQPKHIEVQILADSAGNTVYLFERECSVQRRHQKVVEEAPSPVVDAALRKELGEAAVRVAQACAYRGAGTVEFIMDAERKFYFLEMNTRLQVEHPVTELITGLDLVAEQIRIAEGAVLPFKQEELQFRGHAIEVRIYAEDPRESFLPSPARLGRYRIPAGPGIRVDDGFAEGDDIPVFYDPMIAKLIAYGQDRTQAIARLRRALTEYEIAGPGHNLAFLDFILGHEEFVSGRFDTGFIERYFKPELLDTPLKDGQLAAAAALSAYLAAKAAPVSAVPVGQVGTSAWRMRK
jgi:acetyl-CoA carboxylase, biotin carboxylase subunit